MQHPDLPADTPHPQAHHEGTPGCSFRVATGEGPATLAIHGELDLEAAPQLRACVDELLASGPSELVVDLAGVTFLDSSGTSALVVARQRAAEAGSSFTVAAASPRAVRTLQMAGLAEALGLAAEPPG